MKYFKPVIFFASNNMTSYDGYQWGAIGQYGWYFPYENQYYKGCRDPNVSSFVKNYIAIINLMKLLC